LYNLPHKPNVVDATHLHDFSDVFIKEIKENNVTDGLQVGGAVVIVGRSATETGISACD
jgi:hypothetical protein